MSIEMQQIAIHVLCVRERKRHTGGGEVDLFRKPPNNLQKREAEKIKKEVKLHTGFKIVMKKTN
jgi:hypothetical protein